MLDLSRERAFLNALEFQGKPERRLDGTAFVQLTGLANASANQASLRLGQQSLVLTQFIAPVGADVPLVSANDLGFEHVAIVVRDMDAAYARLRTTRMHPVSPEPQQIPLSNPVAGGVRAVYFRDPEGHFLELLEFPADKGEAAWHRHNPPLFMGIDHSAIASANTARSLQFYRDVLGMHTASESLNEGPEQELLSGVAGARVKITSVHGASGPGVELLEYLAPRDGKAFPAQASAADSVHWEIAIRVASVAETLSALRAAGFGSAAPQAVDTSTLYPGTSWSAALRDPDGHTVRIFELSPNLPKGTQP